VVLVIPEGIGDSEGEGVAFIGLFLDGCHCLFHIQHGVESESEIINLVHFLQGCR